MTYSKFQKERVLVQQQKEWDNEPSRATYLPFPTLDIDRNRTRLEDGVLQ